MFCKGHSKLFECDHPDCILSEISRIKGKEPESLKYTTIMKTLNTKKESGQDPLYRTSVVVSRCAAYIAVSLTRVSHVGRRSLSWKLPPSDWSLDGCMGAFSWLVVDVGGPNSLLPLSSHLGLCKKDRLNKPVSNTPPQPLLEFLPPSLFLQFMLWLGSVTDWQGHVS